MPRRVGEYHPFEDPEHNVLVADGVERLDGGQGKWYEVAGELVKGFTVMDVGAGNGYGMKIMKDAGAIEVDGVDPAPAGPVRLGVGEDITEEYDWITCIDVIEHIEDDEEHPDRNDVFFLNHFLSLARIGVFLSTPNWDVYKCTNWHHYREYTPDEMRELLEGLDYDIWDYVHPDKPNRVDSFDGCTVFGVAIWKNRSSHDAHIERIKEVS